MTNDSRPLPAAQDAPKPAEQEMWSKEFQEFLVDRFGLVQTAARFWLGTVTTLVALFSALLVVNRGESLAALQVGTWGRVVIYVLVVLTYLCAFGAVVRGSQACFGGLSVREPQPEPKPGTDHKPHKTLREQWHPPPMSTTVTWTDFRNDRQDRANDARTYLHQSRALGVGAVAGGILLALVVLALGGFSDDPLDPTHVVVIDNGRLVCGVLERTGDGRVLVDGQELDDVNQLAAVDGC